MDVPLARFDNFKGDVDEYDFMDDPNRHFYLFEVEGKAYLRGDEDIEGAVTEYLKSLPSPGSDDLIEGAVTEDRNSLSTPDFDDPRNIVGYYQGKISEAPKAVLSSRLKEEFEDRGAEADPRFVFLGDVQFCRGRVYIGSDREQQVAELFSQVFPQRDIYSLDHRAPDGYTIMVRRRNPVENEGMFGRFRSWISGISELIDGERR